MRIREALILAFVSLGLLAALVSHELLQAMAAVDLGAPSFGEHPHGSITSVVVVESVLLLCFFGALLRDAAAKRGRPYYRREARFEPSARSAILSIGGIALIATATLFCMEFTESGSAALGLGWLGGSLLPGVIVLFAAVGAAATALYAGLAGRFAGLERLVALLTEALARLMSVAFAHAVVPRTRPRRRLFARSAPCARHAGLRAPPVTTR